MDLKSLLDHINYKACKNVLSSLDSKIIGISMYIFSDTTCEHIKFIPTEGEFIMGEP